MEATDLDNQQTVAVLNELLALETGSTLTRLREAGHYVSWPAAGQMGVLRQMIEDDADHERWLTDEIERNDGAPRPRSFGIQTAGGHYVDAEHLLPRIVADERRLAEAYRQAESVLSPGAAAVRLVSRIRERHERHAQRLDAR